MEHITVTTSFTAYSGIDELPEDVHDLMLMAVDIRKTAYAPYSNFRVGAALLLDNGKIVTGSNQENAAYPSGLCAERVAIYYAGAAYPGAAIVKMAVSAAADAKVVSSPIPPCGSCRQAMAEYEIRQQTPLEIYFMGQEGQVYKSASVSNLLPLIFDSRFL